MGQKIIWSFEATGDLESIAEYIARDSPFYAASFVGRILNVSHTLSSFPLRGRIVPEISSPGIRELLIKEYRLIYHVEESQITILGIIHGRRDLTKLWEEEKREN